MCKKVMAVIIQHQGQPQFRKSLQEAYEGRCALTDCDVECALEAAHILPYAGPDTNHVSNGLLFRADIHTLFDLGVLTIDPADLTVSLDSSLGGAAYKSLHGCRLREPLRADAAPSREALKIRFALLKEK
jgi:predicted restriction endonuclease